MFTRATFSFLGLAAAAAVLLAACNPGAIAVNQGWSGPTVHNGVLYVGSRAGKVLAIPVAELSEAVPLDLGARDVREKRARWQFPIAEDKSSAPLGAIYSSPMVVGDTVLVSMNRVERRKLRPKEGDIYALDPQSGTERWFARTDGGIFASVAADGGRVYTGDEKGYVYAIDAAEGGILWKTKAADKRFWSAPAVADGSVYIGSMDKRLYALDAGTGAVRWSFRADGAIASKPLVVGDMVYFGAFDRKFYALNRKKCADAPSACEPAWVLDGDGWFWNDAVASPDEAVVYVGSLGDSFYALSADKGDVRWRFPTESGEGIVVRSAPVVVGDRVYVVERSGRVLALDRKTGRETASSRILNAKALASPAWAEGFLYVHDMGEKLHKIPAR